MQLVDADRLYWVQQQHCGYDYVRMLSIQPLELTPKNNIIVGIPNNKRVHLENLDCTALVASASENVNAEAGEKHKTGQDAFRSTVG